MLSIARRQPSAILFAAQLSAVLLYPFMRDNGAGRAVDPDRLADLPARLQQ